MLRKSHVALAGKVFPSLQQLALTSDDLRQVTTSLHEAVDSADIIVLVFFGWCTVPIVRIIFTALNKKDDFLHTYAYLFAHLFSQAIRVALVVLAADCLDVTMETLGIELAGRVDFGYVTARAAYTIWAAFQFAVFKRHLIAKAVETRADKLGKAVLFDRLIDLGIAVVMSMFLVDMLDVEIGTGLKSVFALGGVGTIIVSLASKDLGEHVLSGVFLHVSDKFYEGDLVKLGDGTTGTILKIGWFHTIIRLSNDTHMRMPNTKLAHQVVINLSRCTQCQVKTVLYFSHAEMSKMSSLCIAIKEAVRGACPDLITDGSRPFRVLWTDITSDRLEVICDFHFELKPFGDVYWNNRMRCLEAIGGAIDKNGMKHALPTYNVNNY